VKSSWLKRMFRPLVCIVALLGLSYSGLLYWVWSNRTVIVIASKSLDEPRTVTVFGSAEGQTATMIYSLDGDKYRHSLIPAAHSTFIALLSGNPSPTIVAIHDHGGRDKDFRPAQVTPAYWRPNISGRSSAFDLFLLEELRGQVEQKFSRRGKRYLFGHSLGGYYALDMTTRQPQHGFAGIYAFSPTYSHDLSLIDRLDRICVSNKHIYINIGIESGRDTDIFNRAKSAVKISNSCRSKVKFGEHFGVIHGLIMITGQISAFRYIFLT
jgi:predicted alpha/beta superfamily hydrolase